MKVAERVLPFAKRIPIIAWRDSTTPWLIALSGVWLLMVLVANPVGEFPLDDDWSYARAVQNLIEHSRLELSGFTSMPLIAQVFWGALFCLPFGFSFTALRVSTITLGMLGILAAFQLLKELKVDRTLALFAVAVWAFNPLYFLLSLTFMTDVPFFAFSMLSFLFLLRAFRTESSFDLTAGYAFTLVAILIRQLAVVIPLSFLVVYLFKNPIRLKFLRDAAIPSVAFVILVLAFPAILRHTIGLPALYNRSYEPINEAAPIASFQMLFVFADRELVQIMYLGLFILPLLIGTGMNIEPDQPVQTTYFSTFISLIFFVVLLGILIWQGRTMPLTGNMLFDFGLGPPLLRDTYLENLAHWSTAPRESWLIVTLAAVVGGVLLLRRLVTVLAEIIKSLNSKLNIKPASALFIPSAVFFYSVAIAITGFLDRYLIWLLPLLTGLVLTPKNSSRVRITRWPLSVAITVVFALFSLGATHDYLAWNRARWQALNDLMEKDHVSYKNIDGGFEFNGWYAYDAAYRSQPSKSWWWVENDDYVISFGAMPGYVEISQYPFEKWIPFGRENIFVLHRVDNSMPEALATK